LALHLLEAALQPLALGCPGHVPEDRLVHRRRGSEDRVRGHTAYLTAVDPALAVWIGGPQASGKSSIARALAERFGLQLYVVDHRVWVHEARMPRTELASLTMDERW